MQPFKTGFGYDSYYISPQSIDDARELENNGLQRLQPISTTKGSTVSFLVASRSKAHLAAVQISIAIVGSPTTPSNPSYKPDTDIYPCCDKCDLASIQQVTQQIYDVFIRPIQWNLELCVSSLALCTFC